MYIMTTTKCDVKKIMTEKKKFTPTDEQQAAIDSPAKVLLVRAHAGSGKTAMLSGYAERRPQKSMLYLAFNKAIQLEAEGKFPPNVKCQTTHAIAYRAIVTKWGLSREHISQKLGDSRIMEVSAVFNRSPSMCKPFVETVRHFISSADSEIGVHHIPSEVMERLNGSHHALAAVVADAKVLWGMMKDPTNTAIRLPHDGYLKLYQLSNPVLPYDVILFDEAQDSNPVTTAIVQAQRCEKVIVGDSHQAIYQFRGSKDALDVFKCDQSLYLTRSFRFGRGVANFASILLSEMAGATRPVIGMGKHPVTSFWVDRSKPYTVLSRTNAMLFDEAVSAIRDNKKVAFVGGVKGYKIDAIQDAYNLSVDERVFSDGYFNRFESYAHFEEVGKETEDPEINVLCKIVAKYGDEIPGLLDRIKRESMTYDSDAAVKADVILATAHKSKGLEFDQVVLTDDFSGLLDEDGEPHHSSKAKAEDVNLLYVAATRAERALSLPPVAIDWLKKIGVQPSELNGIDLRDWYGVNPQEHAQGKPEPAEGRQIVDDEDPERGEVEFDAQQEEAEAAVAPAPARRRYPVCG